MPPCARCAAPDADPGAAAAAAAGQGRSRTQSGGTERPPFSTTQAEAAAKYCCVLYLYLPSAVGTLALTPLAAAAAWPLSGVWPRPCDLSKPV